MSHAVSMGLISGLFYLCFTTPWLKQPKLQLLIGLVLGLAALVRPQDILFGVVPLLAIAFQRGQIVAENSELKTGLQTWLAGLRLQRGELGALFWVAIGGRSPWSHQKTIKQQFHTWVEHPH